MTKKKISYNEAIEEIEEILQKIENEELDVDELSEKVKRVSSLIKICKQKLYKTEEEVEDKAPWPLAWIAPSYRYIGDQHGRKQGSRVVAWRRHSRGEVHHGN